MFSLSLQTAPQKGNISYYSTGKKRGLILSTATFPTLEKANKKRKAQDKICNTLESFFTHLKYIEEETLNGKKKCFFLLVAFLFYVILLSLFFCLCTFNMHALNKFLLALGLLMHLDCP